MSAEELLDFVGEDSVVQDETSAAKFLRGGSEVVEDDKNETGPPLNKEELHTITIVWRAPYSENILNKLLSHFTSFHSLPRL